MNYGLLVLPVSGAVIGYFTNWIAIKMLFRPLKEKRLFGIKLPFTPGLIPKERHRLAAKLGEALSQNILTRDSLSESLSSPETQTKLEAFIRGICRRVMISDTKLAELFQKPVFAELLSEVDMNNLLDKLITIERIEEFNTNISQRLIAAAKEYSAAKLYERFEPHITEQLERFAPALIDYIINLPESNPAFNEYFNNAVKKMISENTGFLGSLFISSDKVCERIKTEITAYLTDEENRRFVVDKIKTYATRKISEYVIEKNLYEFIEAAAPDSKDWLRNLLSNDTQIKLFLQNIINKHTSELKENFNSMTIGYASSKIKLDAITDRVLAMNILTPFICMIAGFFAENLDISALVEQKINGMEIGEGERIILDVVSKELNVITMLGGVLGFIIGFFSVAMQMLL